MAVGQGRPETAEQRGARWLSIAEGRAKEQEGYKLYPGDWAALAATLRGLLPRPSDEPLRDAVPR